MQDEVTVGEDVAAVAQTSSARWTCCSTSKHGAARALGVGAHDREEALDDDGGKAERELVEQEQGRLAGERPPDGEHLLLTAGEQPGAAGAQLGEGGEVLVGDLLVERLARGGRGGSARRR